MLMLSRFIVEMMRASGGDGMLVTTVAVGGVRPTLMAPSTVMPCAASAARNAPAVNVAGSPTTSW